MKPPRELEVQIASLAQTGEGVARVEGRPVLVRGTLPGERARVRYHRDGRVELVQLLEAGPGRLEPRCAIVDACGGCTWQHASAEVQRAARLDQLRRALPAALREARVAYHAAPARYEYRSRARMAWSVRGGHTTLGFRARGSHEIADVSACPVLVPELSRALGPVRASLGVLGGQGELALARGAGGAPVVSLRPARMPDAAGFAVCEALVAAGFAGASLWPPGASAPAVSGDPRPVVRGADGAPLVLAEEGFAQANEEFNAALGAEVLARAAAGGQRVLELYAGAGNFTVLLARDARRVSAVEADAGAVAALRANVAARALGNVSVVEADADGAIRGARADVVVLDPPRTGARAVCEALAREAPRRLVYVSCDPPTLGRDLGVLHHALDLEALAAFEMFPQTPHLELVATLVRRVGRGATMRRGG